MPNIRPFVNWARNVRSLPQEWYRVKHEEDLMACVQKARRDGRRVKALGSRHSWSAVAAPDGVGLEMHDYAGLVDLDREAGRITVRSGTRLRDLNRILEQVGLALPILGSVTAQTIAGATATGTHGSSLVHGPLSSLIEEMRIVDGSGDIVTLGADRPELQGARVHLGALGLLSTLTLRVERAFRLEEQGSPLPWEKALADLTDLARGTEYIKLWWLPHTDQVQVFRYTRTDAPITFSQWGRWADQAIINRWIFPCLLSLGRWRPSWIPAINRFLEPQYFKPFRRVGRSFDVLPLAMPPRHQEMEYAVPLERAPAALLAIREMIEREKLCVDFILEMRFVPNSTSWMSPSYGQDACHIGLYMADSRDQAAYFRGGEEILWAHGGRPHWGKELGRGMQEILSRYPQFTAFRDLATQLDPDRIFHNAFLDAMFASPKQPNKGERGGVSTNIHST